MLFLTFPLHMNYNGYHGLRVSMFPRENCDHAEVGPSPLPTCSGQGSLGKVVPWLTPRGSLGIHDGKWIEPISDGRTVV